MSVRVTLFSDNLDKADQTLDVTPYDRWNGQGVDNLTALLLRSNAAEHNYGPGASLGASHYTEALPQRQWSECNVIACPGSDAENSIPQFIGCTVRSSGERHGSTQGNDGYMVVVGDVAATGAPQELELQLIRADNPNFVDWSIVWSEALGDSLPVTLSIEAEGADVRLYVDGALRHTYTDPSPLTYSYAGWVSSDRDKSPRGRVDDFACGELIDEASAVIDNVNGNDTVASLGTLQINGSDLGTVTAATISDAGARPYSLTLSSITNSQVVCQPFDILNTQLGYGTLRITLTHGAGTVTHDVTVGPAAGWQYVTLASVNTAYLAKSIPNVADGDLLEAPTSLGGSTVMLFPDSDAHYDPAVQDGTQHERRHFDVSTNTWDSGPVTINRGAAEAPSWRAAPNPPPAIAGQPYSYAIGELLDGTRPMTLTDAGTPLPTGLSYNDSSYPETIEGTPPGASGTVTITGIVTKAENAA